MSSPTPEQIRDQERVSLLRAALAIIENGDHADEHAAWMQQTRETLAQAEPQPATLEAFFAAHPDCPQIVCDFNGEGDSGCIETPSVAVGGVNLPRAVAELARDLAEKALDKQGLDWWNNDGGFGEVTILRDLSVQCQTNLRRTESDFYEQQYTAAELAAKPPPLAA